jgi:hypothetical protein
MVFGFPVSWATKPSICLSRDCGTIFGFHYSSTENSDGEQAGQYCSTGGLTRAAMRDVFGVQSQPVKR